MMQINKSCQLIITKRVFIANITYTLPFLSSLFHQHNISQTNIEISKSFLHNKFIFIFVFEYLIENTESLKTITHSTEDKILLGESVLKANAEMKI